MKDYIFTEGLPDGNPQFDFEQSLFNLDRYRVLQNSERWHSFFAVQKKTRRIAAAVHFHITQDQTAISPLQAPFGSIDYAGSFPPTRLYDFIQYFEVELTKKGVREIWIKNPPELYNPSGPILTTMLLNQHYSIVSAEVDSLISVKHGSIHRKLHRSERRKLSKSESEQLQIRRLPVRDLEKIYNFIDQCRTAKGYKLSLSLDELKKPVKEFPDRYLLFGAYRGRHLVAAAISVIVRKDILYQFYHDHDPAFDHLSPVVKLVADIHEYCFKHGINKLDLGTAAVDNMPNFGLLNFKLFLGGTPNSKFTFEKQLAK